MINGENNKKFYSIKEASNFTGLGFTTLRKMADDKQVKTYRTPNGQRRFDKQSLQEMCSNNYESNIEKKNFLYSRVSSKKQVDDLKRQSEFIKSSDNKYSSYILIEDIGSGINFKRKGLKTILDSCLQGTIGELIIAHKDRLCRFGFEIIEYLIQSSGGKIIILDNKNNKSSEQELSEDILSIIHIFNCRQMGKRKYKSKINENNKNKIVSYSDSEI